MKRITLLIMTALATGVPSLLAEDKNVTVSETIIPDPVYFNTPTATDGVKHSITINNGSSKYDINTVIPAPDSPSDTGSWKCKASSTSAMVWKITALKKTALAYDITGGITEKPPKKTGSGTGTWTPDKKTSLSKSRPKPYFHGTICLVHMCPIKTKTLMIKQTSG